LPIIKSAKKRVQTAQKAAVRNFKTKRNLKQAHKEFVEALAKKDKKAVNETHTKLQSAIDVATKKNVLHKNKAARKKSAYSNMAKSVAGSPASPKVSSTKTSKPAAKKTTTAKKKAPTKAKASAKTTKAKK
jgi:small subunit ribosomal protein S20